MSTKNEIADFLHLFSQEDGFKFLTHDIKASGLDLLEYTYHCQETLLDWSGKVPDDIFNLVKGYVFGPFWTDFEGKVHTCNCASEEWVKCYLDTGEHPMLSPAFASEVDAFRNSIRFRSGQLDKYIASLKEKFPKLNLCIDRAFKGADFYTSTHSIRQAIEEILSSMEEFSDTFPEVMLNFDDEECGDYSKASIIIEQLGSFPKHDFERDQKKLLEGGGTLANIKKTLAGFASWNIESRWEGDSSPHTWSILGDGYDGWVEHYPEGFRHIISIIYKA